MYKRVTNGRRRGSSSIFQLPSPSSDFEKSFLSEQKAKCTAEAAISRIKIVMQQLLSPASLMDDDVARKT